jgi:hypothetical protein
MDHPEYLHQLNDIHQAEMLETAAALREGKFIQVEAKHGVVSRLFARIWQVLRIRHAGQHLEQKKVLVTK